MGGFAVFVPVALFGGDYEARPEARLGDRTTDAPRSQYPERLIKSPSWLCRGFTQSNVVMYFSWQLIKPDA